MRIVAHITSLNITSIGSPFLCTLGCIKLTSPLPIPLSVNTRLDLHDSLPTFFLFIPIAVVELHRRCSR